MVSAVVARRFVSVRLSGSGMGVVPRNTKTTLIVLVRDERS
jgi:hypothetical protein